MTLALIALGILQLADVWTTFRFLERGGVEKNPVIAKLMGMFGQWGWVVVKLIVAGGAGYALWWSDMPELLWAVNALYAFVVWRNSQVAR